MKQGRPLKYNYDPTEISRIKMQGPGVWGHTVSEVAKIMGCPHSNMRQFLTVNKFKAIIKLVKEEDFEELNKYIDTTINLYHQLEIPPESNNE